jgi:sugar lactone lactonase YvrE
LVQSHPPPDSEPLAQFSAWLLAHRRQQEPSPEIGAALARERRSALKRLIASDPRAALAHAVPRTVRASLPAPILAELETPIDATGRLEVLVSCADQHREVTRFAVVGDRRFAVHTFGDRLGSLSRHTVALHGIAIDDALALAPEAFRRLEPAELPAATAATVVVAVGDRIREFHSEAELARWQREVMAAEALPGPEVAPPGVGPEPARPTAAAPAEWTLGEKSVLWLRAEFAGESGLVATDAAIDSSMQAVSAYFGDVSRGRTSFRTTIAPGAFRLPRDRAYYNAGTGRIAELEAEVLRLAREFDAANGNRGTYHPDRHDRWIIVFRHLSVYRWGGTAFVGDKGVRLNDNISPGVVAHELGHNHGLSHSHAWKPYDSSGIGAGAHEEYGDAFDVMGDVSTLPAGHFNTTHKETLNYLAPDEIARVSGAGTYRLQRHDDRAARGVQVLKLTAGRYEYSLEHRRLWPRTNFAHGPRLESGVLLHWSKVPASFPGRGTYLLDGTPASPSGLQDAPLGLGETFVDPSRGLSITPVAVGGEGATAWIDVRVDLGATGSNRNPVIAAAAPATVVPARHDVVLSASASDPDGDPISFLWEIGEDEIATTSPTLTYRWIAGGNYTVRCSALDGRGGFATRSFDVTVDDSLATWTRRGQATISSSFYAGVFARNQFVFVGNGAGTSPDGIAWTRGTVPANVLYQGLAFNDSHYVAAGYRFDAGRSTLTLGRSTDGRTWQEVGPADTAGQFRGIAYGAGRFVAVGLDGAMLQSADGLTWSRPTIDNSRTLRAIRFAAGRFLAVGDAGTVFVSTDGLTWQNRSVETASYFYAVAHHRNEWIVGASGEAWHSTDDGATWVQSFPPGRPLFHRMASTTGAELLLVSHVATDELYVSETGHTWAVVPVTLPKTANYQWAIAEGNGTVVVAGNGARIFQSSLRSTLAAPTVATPPRAQTVATGQTFTLGVTASGSALSYQWFKDDVPIPGATSVTYSVAGATPENSGRYSVAVGNILGRVVTPAASVTVEARTAHIVHMAASRSASAGSEVSLTVTAGGRPPLSYRWQRDGLDLPDATGAVLTFRQVLPSDAGTYTVVVSDAGSSHTSSPAILTVTGEVPYTAATLAGTFRSAGTTDLPDVRFTTLGEIALDALGNLFVADRSGHTIRRITPAGVVSTFAGRAASSGFADGTGTAAAFNLPNALVFDRAGNLFVTDTNNNRIRRITPAGVVSTFVGQQQGALDGTGTAARLGLPAGLALDADGNFYCTESLNHTVRRITPAGIVTTLAGSARNAGFANGPGPDARFNFNAPPGLAVDAAGRVYVADPGNHVIRRIEPDGTVSTFAGTPGTPGTRDGPLAAALFIAPRALAFDSAGNLFVAASTAVRRITPAGVVSTLLGGTSGYVDGIGTAARFATLSGLAIDPVGQLYLADNGNILVRKATLLGRRGSRLANLSVRTRAGLDADTLIVGFVLDGGAKSLLLRAVGPALGAFAIAGTLADPTLRLDGAAGLVARNDDWHNPATGTAATVSSVAAAVGAFALPPGGRDAALLQSLGPGAYTAQVGGGTGVALVEVYDTAPGAASRLANVSARTRAGSGDDALILGFVVAGDSPRTVLVRAVGPTLAGFGVDGALAAPRLELFRGSTVLAENSGWSGQPDIAAAAARVGAFSLDPSARDAALLLTLFPGAYTVQVSSTTAASGIALIEIYDVP